MFHGQRDWMSQPIEEINKAVNIELIDNLPKSPFIPSKLVYWVKNWVEKKYETRTNRNMIRPISRCVSVCAMIVKYFSQAFRKLYSNLGDKFRPFFSSHFNTFLSEILIDTFQFVVNILFVVVFLSRLSKLRSGFWITQSTGITGIHTYSKPIRTHNWNLFGFGNQHAIEMR